nr:GntR family transcriptional regulator [Thalassobacillus sp. CUG 92003]
MQQIRAFITAQGLLPGDRLPSERELSDTLQVSRSSLREALRAIELLGLIETRRGEGTFVQAYRTNRTIELLSTFILNESRTREELIHARQMLEKEVIIHLAGRLEGHELQELRILKETFTSDDRELYQQFFSHLFTVHNYQLLTRMWELIDDFISTYHPSPYNHGFYSNVVSILKNGSPIDVHDLYESE